MSRLRWALFAALCACGPQGNGDAGVGADAFSTRNECPPASTLTYGTFGEAFFTAYCIRCHSEANTTIATRNGAPMDVNFDRLDLIVPLSRRIDRMAAVGPGAANRVMPLNGTAPSDDERRQLGEWLACGAP